ncbi:hypothetical protein TWF281_002652 [Arthrobotrys megalospora]
MSLLDDFKRRFPLGLGEPIVRHKCRYPDGELLFVHEGGPVDLRNSDVIAEEVANSLKFRPYEPATEEEVHARATNPVKGIIYDKDKTYRYFIWLTVSRTYQRRPGKKSNGDGGGSRGGKSGDESEDGEVGAGVSRGDGGREEKKEGEIGEEVWTKTVKVPFLIWMGSAYSFLSFDAVDIFFTGPEFEYSRYQLSVDGKPFLFHAPDENSGFNHYNILGRDFMESRFKTCDADYTNLTVLMKRRKNVLIVPGQPVSFGDGDTSGDYRQDDEFNEGGGGKDREKHGDEWVKRRDEDLERFLEEDEEEDGSDEKGKKAKEGEAEAEGFKKVDDKVEANIDPRLLEMSASDKLKWEQLQKLNQELLEMMRKEDLEDMREMERNRARDQQAGLRERKTDREVGEVAASPMSPMSRKEGKRAGLVSKENMRISGGRTGSGMRR